MALARGRVVHSLLPLRKALLLFCFHFSAPLAALPQFFPLRFATSAGTLVPVRRQHPVPSSQLCGLLCSPNPFLPHNCREDEAPALCGDAGGGKTAPGSAWGCTVATTVTPRPRPGPQLSAVPFGGAVSRSDSQCCAGWGGSSTGIVTPQPPATRREWLLKYFRAVLSN